MDRSLFSKNYIVAVVAASLFYTGAYMANSVCGKYAVAIGGSNTAAGFAVAAFTLASFFTRPVWGWLVDSRSRRSVCMVGALLCLGASVVLIFVKDIPMLAVSRLVFGRGYSALSTAGGAVVCDIVPAEKLPRAIAFYGISGVVAGAVAPVAGLWLYDRGYMLQAVAVAAVSACVPLLFLFLKYDEEKFLNKGAKLQIFEKSALPAAKTIVFFALSVAAVNSFIPLMAEERNIGTGKIFFFVSALFTLLTRVVYSRFIKKWGAGRLFYMAGGIYTLAFLVLAVAESSLWLTVSAMLYGLGAGFIHPIVNTAAVQSCRRDEKGLATGTFMMSQDIGMTIGAPLWAALSGRAGFGAVYFAVAVVILAMMYIFSRTVGPLLE